MDRDFSAYQRGDFPVDQPIEALRTDHRFVRELFERYFHAQDENERKDLGRHILTLLETHAAIEEAVFYPRVRAAEPTLIDQFEQEHDEARQLMMQLRLMDESNPQMGPMFRQLADAVLRHVETEEQQLFPKVEQANLDMGSIGSEMQAVELQMIADRLQKPIAPGLRQ